MKIEDHPLVSVILCFYNEQLFLEEAIQSVLSQSYESWELILVDDGSSDGSVVIAREYAACFPDKIFYVDHPYHQNRGHSPSRIAGISKCRGKYVAFLDADDVWLPGKLKNQLQIFSNNPGVTVTVEASLYWNSWDNKQKTDQLIQVGVKEGIYKAPELLLALYPLGRGAAPCPSGMMVHAAVLKRCTFEDLFRGIYQVYEDQAFLSKVYLKEAVYVSGAFHNKYRQRSASLVSSVHENGHYHQVRSFFLYWLKDYLKSQPYHFKKVYRLLRRAQMPYREPFLYKIVVEIPKEARKILIRVLIRLGILNYSKSW